VSAENTDLLAVLRRLEELRQERRWDGRTMTVVGAGGAARATLAAARELGANATVLARPGAAVETVARTFGARLGDPAAEEPASLLVHATPVGREATGALDLPAVPRVAPAGHVLDWVYAPRSPELRRLAERSGATYEDGWRLLVYQAAASHEIWWGHAPAEASVDRAVTEGPCAD